MADKDKKDEGGKTSEMPAAPAAAEKGKDEDAEREAARDQLDGGLVKVRMKNAGVYRGKEYEAGSQVEMNKLEALDAVRHGAATFLNSEEEAKAKKKAKK